LDILLNIISFGIKPLYEKQLIFYKIIEEFKIKLPRKQNQAKKPNQKEIEKDFPHLKKVSKYSQVIDLTHHKMSLTESDIDTFYNRLNNIDFKFILFKNYYKKFIRNLNRFEPKAENGNFHLALLSDLLEETDTRPLKPFSVIKYHLKYEYKLTSKIYELISR
jgi:hypothetical protein